MRITVEQMINDYFGGDRQAAADAVSVSVPFLNNWLSQKREVLLLHNDDFILTTKTQKIFKRKK